MTAVSWGPAGLPRYAVRVEGSAGRPEVGPRRDLQGLRAFAVLAVVLDHLFGWPHGGFVGVDIFFVLSGFLITGLLLREHAVTGRISFAGFYRRRVKRIVPAAVLVMAATVLGAWFVFSGPRFETALGDTLAAFLFVANWRFAAQSTDYFAQDLPVSPLRQFWSLAVEEQFYVVWPVLLLALLTLAARRGDRGRGWRTTVGAALVAVTAASFAWALWETANVPDRAYFSTLSRTWELGVGALLAVAAPLLARIPDLLRPVLSWLGLLGMTASLWIIGPESAFPAPAALLPVASAAAVVAAGTGVAQQRWLAPLTNPVSTYVGDISYSLYLWHFPIIVLGTAVWGSGPLALAGLGIAIVVASAYSYHLVEDPVRRSSWLDERRSRAVRDVDAPLLSAGQHRGWTSLAVLLSVLLLVALQRSVPERAPVTVAQTDVAVTSPGDPSSSATGALRADIRQALGATSWPETSPPMDEAVGGPQAPDEVLACGTKDLDLEACSWGPADASQTAVVVGDSIAMTYVETLREALPDWRVISLGGFGCTFTTELIANSAPDLEEACPARKLRAVETVQELRPDLVFVSNIQYPRVPKGSTEPLTEQEWAEGTVALVEQLLPAAGEVVFLAPPPADKDVTACYTRVSTPGDCVSLVTAQWEERAATERAMAREVDGTWLDSSTWFCVDGRCPAFVGTTPTKVDAVHMTTAYAEAIAPALREDLVAAGLL